MLECLLVTNNRKKCRDASLRATGGNHKGETALETAEEVEKKSWESDEGFAARQKGCLEVAALLRG